MVDCGEYDGDWMWKWIKGRDWSRPLGGLVGECCWGFGGGGRGNVVEGRTGKGGSLRRSECIFAVVRRLASVRLHL